MPINTLSFKIQVDSWVQETERRVLAVFRESSKRVVSNAQERLRPSVDTGYLRSSIQVSLKEMPPTEIVSRRDPNATYQDTTPVAVLEIARATLDDAIFVGWTANYAIYIENGSSKKSPEGFVAISAQEWPFIVAQVAEEAKQRSGT